MTDTSVAGSHTNSENQVLTDRFVQTLSDSDFFSGTKKDLEAYIRRWWERTGSELLTEENLAGYLSALWILIQAKNEHPNDFVRFTRNVETFYSAISATFFTEEDRKKILAEYKQNAGDTLVVAWRGPRCSEGAAQK